MTLGYASVALGVVTHLERGLVWPVSQMAIETASLGLLLVGLLLAGTLGGRRFGRAVGLDDTIDSGAGYLLVLEFVFAMAILAVVLVLRANLRDLVPVLNERLHDSDLWQMDAWIHGGLEPAADLAALAAEIGMLPVLDRTAVLIGMLVAAGPIFFWANPVLRPVRGRMLVALLLLCAGVAILQILWPAIGPAFYRPSRFAELAMAPRTEHLQWAAMADYLRIREGAEGATVALRTGVAALPAFEIGILVVFTLAAARRSRLGIFFFGATVVAFGASLALGWHYAVDGYTAGVLGMVCWFASGRLCGRTSERPDGLSAARASCDGGA